MLLIVVVVDMVVEVVSGVFVVVGVEVVVVEVDEVEVVVVVEVVVEVVVVEAVVVASVSARLCVGILPLALKAAGGEG